MTNYLESYSSQEKYESPALQTVEFKSEGVLCQSGQFEKWNEDTLEW